MILRMYSIHDRLNGYTPPIPFLSDDIAMRYFKDQYIGNPTVFNTPEDFDLFFLGTFDKESGTYIQTKDDIKCILKGADLIGNKNTVQNSIQRSKTA